MRDSFFASPLRDVVDHLLQTVPVTKHYNADLYHLSWELELLLLDDRSPERQWRQAAAKPLAKMLPLVRNTEFVQDMDVSELQILVADLAV